MSELTCAACGAACEPAETFCGVCGTPRTPAGRRAPEPRLATTTEPLPARAPSVPVDLPVDLSLDLPGTGDLPAGTGRRVVALVLDLLAVGVLGGLVVAVLALSGAVETQVSATLPAPVLVAGALTEVLGLLALGVWEGTTGRTLGNLALGLRTLDAATASPIGAGRGVLRWAILWVAQVVPVAGQLLVLLSPLFDRGPARQGWQDKAARSVVLHLGPRPTRPSSAAPSGVTRPEPAVPAGPHGPTVPDAGTWAAPPASPPAAGPWAAPGAGLITGVPGAPAEEPDEIDDRTQLGGAHRRTVEFELELEDGSRARIAGPTLLGRSPAPDAEHPDVVTLRDRTVSRTHLELGIDGGPWLVDRGSTSGTFVVRPGSEPAAALPGVRVPLSEGSAVQVGDRRLVVRQVVR